MMIPQEGRTEFLGRGEFLGNGGPEIEGTETRNAQPRAYPQGSFCKIGKIIFISFW